MASGNARIESLTDGCEKRGHPSAVLLYHEIAAEPFLFIA
jgi:hypothetical protein